MSYTHYFERAKNAAGIMRSLSAAAIDNVLNTLAEAIVAETGFLLEANRKDLQRMPASDPKYDRLKLTDTRIRDIAADIRTVAGLNNPLGRTLSEKTLDNGLQIRKVSVPLGVVSVIYEARPNVTLDVFSLCFKTGNVTLEKGQPLSVVDDQWRMPTLAEDLAVACISAARKGAEGIFHISGKDMFSIYELVEAVADFWKLDTSGMKRVSSATLSQDAPRPARTGFILDKAYDELDYRPHSFREGLGLVDRQLKAGV